MQQPGSIERRRRRSAEFHAERSPVGLPAAINARTASTNSDPLQEETTRSLVHPFQRLSRRTSPAQPLYLVQKRMRTSDRPPPSGQPQTGRQAPVVEPVSNILVEMGDNYRELQKLQEEQIQKASMRYPRHPEYQPPIQQDTGSGRGLHGDSATTRSQVGTPQGITPDQSRRRFYDPTGAEGCLESIHTRPRHAGNRYDSISPHKPWLGAVTEIRSLRVAILPPSSPLRCLDAQVAHWNWLSDSLDVDLPFACRLRGPASRCSSGHGSSNLYTSQSGDRVAGTKSAEPGGGSTVNMGWYDGRLLKTPCAEFRRLHRCTMLITPSITMLRYRG